MIVNIQFTLPALTTEQEKALLELMHEERCYSLTDLVRQIMLKEIGARVATNEEQLLEVVK